VIETGSLDEAVEQLSEKGPVTLAIFDLERHSFDLKLGDLKLGGDELR
jgi:hypothetical protein